MTTATLDHPVSVTERAVTRIRKIIENEEKGTMLRVSVEGGGCSGFSYKFDLVTEKNESDLVLERPGVIILIDDVSINFMQGAEIDFVDALIGASFQINNPNATASCGCGTSFAV